MRKHSPCQVIFSPPYTLTRVLFSDSVPGIPNPHPPSRGQTPGQAHRRLGHCTWAPCMLLIDK